MKSIINLFVIEDHDVTIAGIRGYFRASRDHIRVAGAASTIDEALVHPQIQQSNMILLDLWIGDSEPMQNLVKLRTAFPYIPVVIFTSENSKLWQTAMMEGGARGYISKSFTRSEIKSLLTTISKEDSISTPMVSGFALPNQKPSLVTPQKYPLTDHQKLLLKHLAKGRTQADTAKELDITLSTVEKSLKHLRIKFDVKNCTELIQLVVKNRLL